MKKVTAISEPTNDGAFAIEASIPYIVQIQITGTAGLGQAR